MVYCEDVNTAFIYFNNIFQQNLNYFAPVKNVLENSNFCFLETQPILFVNQLTKLKFKQNKAHAEWKRDQDNKEKRALFLKIRKSFGDQGKKSEKQFYWNKSKTCMGDSRH